MKRIPFLTLAITALTVGIALTPGAADALQFDREAIGAGQFWRLFSGHLTHFGRQHLLYDAVVFVLLGSLIEWRDRRRLVKALTIAAPVISIMVWWLQPEFVAYRGLSGIDSALFGCLVTAMLRKAWRDRDRLSAAVALAGAAAFLGKSTFELMTGSALFVSSQGLFVAVPLAHLVGAAVGALVCARTPVRGDPGYQRSKPRRISRPTETVHTEVDPPTGGRPACRP